MTSHITRSYKIRTWEDWKKACDAAEVTPAERKLMEACANGVSCTVGNGKRPDAPTPDNEIGADLLRYLIKGGCGHEECKLHEWGVDLHGAYVADALDLRNLDAAGVTGILRSTLAEPINAMNARFNILALNGSACEGIVAQNAEVKGSVFFRMDFSAKGEVSISGAQIGGQLACDGGRFENEGGDALSAQGTEVRGPVFLSEGFSAKGVVRLSSAQIGGQLACDGGRFENEGGDALDAQGAEVKGSVYFRKGFFAKGMVRLSSAQINGQLACDGGRFENEGGDALNAQGAKVKNFVFFSDNFSAKGEVSISGAQIGGQLACVGGRFENEGGVALDAQEARMAAFLWREVEFCSGDLNLAGLEADTLFDDPDSWMKPSHVYLDGFEYKTIHGPLDARTRLAWLRTARAYDGSFSPQPYEQLAHVLKTMGHDEQRRVVLVEKERLTRRAIRQRIMKEFSGQNPFLAVYAGWLGFVGFLQWVVVGYGLRPFRSLISLGVLFVFATFVFHKAYEAGDFAPNSAVVLSTQEWRDLADRAENPAKAWSAESGAGRDYETFNRYAYAADVVVPIIPFGQEAAWAPSTTRGAWGYHAWWLRWFFKTCGWIVTALGAAAITGIIRRE